MAKVKGGRFYNHGRPQVFDYSRRVQSDLIAAQDENKLNIGMIVNWGLNRVLTDDSRAEMIEDFERQLQDSGLSKRQRRLIQEAILALQTAPLHVEAEVMNDLEGEIDAFAKGERKNNASGDLYDRIYKDNNTAKHFPWCFDQFGGYNDEGRIPRYLRGDKKPPLAKTKLCRSLEVIQAMVQELEDDVILMRYEQMAPLPISIMTRPTHPLSVKVAERWDSVWRKAWRSLNADEDGSDVDRDLLYVRLSSEFGAKLLSWPLPFRYDVVCELLKAYYPGFIGLERIPVYPEFADEEQTIPHPKAGRPMPHVDGLVWTPVIGKVAIDLLVSEGEAYKYLPIALYKDYRDLRDERHVAVAVENGVVHRKVDNAIVGTCLQLADGEYDMQLGIVWEPKLAAPVIGTEDDVPAEVVAEDARDQAAASEEGTYEPDPEPRYRVEEVLLSYGFRCAYERLRVRYWEFAEEGRFQNADGDNAFFEVFKGEALYANSQADDDPTGLREPEELAKFIEDTFGVKPLKPKAKAVEKVMDEIVQF